MKTKPGKIGFQIYKHFLKKEIACSCFFLCCNYKQNLILITLSVFFSLQLLLKKLVSLLMRWLFLLHVLGPLTFLSTFIHICFLEITITLLHVYYCMRYIVYLFTDTSCVWKTSPLIIAQMLHLQKGWSQSWYI